MKLNNIRNLAALSVVFAFSACTENSWNDRLDGFEVPPVYEEVQSITYTLTSADYTSIASNSVNQAIAKALGESDALTAIGNNKCFQNSDQAQRYLPAFMDSPSFQYFTADNGSSALINYALPVEGGTSISFLNPVGDAYKVTEAQYQNVWGSDDDYINAFAPNHPASSYLPNILKETFPDAQQGDYAVVNYNEAQSNPIFGSVAGVEDEGFQMTSVIKDVSVGDNLNIKGIVTGISTRGFVVTDKAGSIVYDSGANGFNDDAIQIGAEVEVTGTVSDYSRCLQVGKQQSYKVVGESTYTYPKPVVYTSEMIDAACAETDNMLAQYVKVTAKVSISGNYINLIFDGATAQGSVYYAPDFIKSQLTDGEEVTLTGYFVAVTSSGKYFNILVTGVGDDDTVKISDSIKNLAKGDELTATAVVTAQCTQGVILTDNAGSILYYNRNINLENYPIGTIVTVSGTVDAYRTGLQLTDSAVIEVVGTESYNYPVPLMPTATEIEAACDSTDDHLAIYVALQGKINISGNYYNIEIDGLDTSAYQGSLYNVISELKAELTSGENYTFYGYFTSVSASGNLKYYNIVLTDVEGIEATKAFKTRSQVGSVVTVSTNAVYMFDNGAWVLPPKTIVLQPSDYTDMDQSYGNLSNDLPATLLPIYLEKNYPYAQEDDVMTVIYKYYNGSSTSYTYSQFVNDGMAWTGWISDNMASDRFSKSSNAWAWNPSVSITLPYIRNDATSVTFYQACVDWVYENIDVPYYGSTSLTSGLGFVTTYGNNEYYTGASAYYCNVDTRPGSARNQCSTGFGDFPGYGEMTDDEVVMSMKEHFDQEVVPAVLAKLYPDAVPVEGMDVTYSVTFTQYALDGAFVQTGVWKVVGPAQFEFVSNTWYGTEN